MNFETASENVRTMDEAAKDPAAPDKKNEESIEADVLPGKKLILLKTWMHKKVHIPK